MIPVKVIITLAHYDEDEDKYIEVFANMPYIPNQEDLITITHPKCVGEDYYSAVTITIEVLFSVYIFDLNNNFCHVEIHGIEG